MFRKLMATSPTWVTVPLRLAVAAIFVAHGAQKVLGSFSGPGLEKWISGTTPIGFMKPAWLWLAAAAFAELVGGILVFLGLLTRVAAFLIACVMLTALIGVHSSRGFFMNTGGIEYALACLAMSLALVISGGGMASVDLAIAGGRKR
jgi:putative oxidoreductase